MNNRGAVITDMNSWYQTTGNPIDDAGEEIEFPAVRSVRLQGEDLAHVIHRVEADLSGELFDLDFTGARGRRWIKPLSSPFVMKGPVR